VVSIVFSLKEIVKKEDPKDKEYYKELDQNYYPDTFPPP